MDTGFIQMFVKTWDGAKMHESWQQGEALVLTHRSELIDQLFLSPLLLAHLSRQAGHLAGLGVVGGVRNIQVVHQYNIGILKSKFPQWSKPKHCDFETKKYCLV